MARKGRHGATRNPKVWAERCFGGKRSKPGVKNPAAKLTPAKVREIRRLRAGGAEMRKIADQFGVGKSTIFRVIHAEAKGGWAHV